MPRESRWIVKQHFGTWANPPLDQTRGSLSTKKWSRQGRAILQLRIRERKRPSRKPNRSVHRPALSRSPNTTAVSFCTLAGSMICRLAVSCRPLATAAL